MATVTDLTDARQERRTRRLETRDPEQAEVFPGVSLADLRRLWALDGLAQERQREIAVGVRVG